MAFPTPPLDGSGGVLAIKIAATGVSRHVARVHIPPFNPTPEATAVVGNTDTDYAYSTPLPGVATAGSTLEPSVGQTAIDLMDAIKPLYGTGTQLSVAGLWKSVPVTVNGVATTQLEQVFPLPEITPVNGTNAAQTLAQDIARYLTSYYSGRTQGNAHDTANPGSGRHFRLSLNAIALRMAPFLTAVSPTAGGYDDGTNDQRTADQALVGYLSQKVAVNGFSSVIVGHDGTPPAPNFQLRVNTTKRAWRFLIENT